MGRCCRTCRWFQAAQAGRTGECAHPEIEAETGVRLMVWSKELHCRQGWGEDRWEVAEDDVVLEIRVREPDAGAGDQGVRVASPAPGSRAVTPSAEAVICAWGATRISETAAER